MTDHITETETLALMNAQQQITIATLQHRLVVERVRAAHGLAPEDQIAPDGTIVRAPAAQAEPAPAPEPPPTITTEEP